MTNSRLFDCFMYAGEASMLQMRLHELAGKVHRHVIVEADVTHRGHPKPLWYPMERERFAKWEDRITYVHAKDLPEGRDNWARERAQRNAASAALHDAQPDDLILIADVDELPSDAALAWRGSTAAALMMRTAHSAVDLLYPEPQFASVIARWGWVQRQRLSEVREGRYGYERIEGGGWHFSWVGSQADRIAKLDHGTCHTEMPGAEWLAIWDGSTYERGEHHNPGTEVVPVDVDESWPAWIRERRCPATWFRPREAA